MKEPDFSGIDPLRVPEARRRIAAIQTYMALPDPKTADAIRIGASVGLSRWTFVRLVQVWSKYREARRLVMDRRGNSGRASIIDPGAAAIVDEAIQEFGTDAKLATISEWIEARCVKAGVEPPAKTTIWQRMRKAQAANDSPASGPPRVVIGRMWFHLPVEGAGPEAMPVVLVAVMLPERVIVAHRISLDPGSPPVVGDLILDLAGSLTPGADPRPLRIEAADRQAAIKELEMAGLARIPAHRRSLQIEISKAYGGRLGPLKALYRQSLARPAARKAGIRQAQPLTYEEAIDAIETAIRSSNGAAGTAVPPFTIDVTHPVGVSPWPAPQERG